MPKPTIFKSLDEVYYALEELKKADNVTVEGEWDLYQNLAHCSQTVEFSMKGFPVPRPRIFQLTVGLIAFKVFDSRGYMTHDTNEPVPGAELISPNGKLEGILRLQTALEKFEKWNQPVHPHFAFGPLTKDEFARAHCMHIANHFDEFQY